jgi:formylglycine-generating enzyme required for sulfatase activity
MEDENAAEFALDPPGGESPPDSGMSWVPGGAFRMGSDNHYAEEAPAGTVEVDGFWMDQTTVTNGDFARFVDETGYVTVAEKAPDPEMYPGADPELLVPGSIVFSQPPGPVDLADPRSWWAWVPGASWRTPWGPGSDIAGLEDHPVTQVAYEDAAAYADWVGKILPSEAQWERAARGGIEGAEFAWGDEIAPDGRERMNRWIGEFPWKFRPRPGGRPGPGTVAVRAFEPNPFGLYEVCGNTWEWTRTFFTEGGPGPAKSCCVPRDPQGPGVEASRDPATGIPRKVLKGGSFLCAENYCSRYRPASRIPETVESATCHISFRCVSKPGKRQG